MKGSIQTKFKFDKKPKTPKQKIAGWGFSIVVCVWNVRNKPKTREQIQNSETKNRGAGVEHRGVCVCVCVWNIQNKPKTREQTQNLATKNRKRQNSFITESRKVCKLFVSDAIHFFSSLILIFNLLRKILFNTYFNFQPLRANEISLESSSFVHCEYCFFK